MKNAVFLVVFLLSVLQLLFTANIVPSSLILLTLKMEAIRSSETLVPIRATWRHIIEDGIRQRPILLGPVAMATVYFCSLACLLLPPSHPSCDPRGPNSARLKQVACKFLDLHVPLVSCGVLGPNWLA
jgi:hypothetical protein